MSRGVDTLKNVIPPPLKNPLRNQPKFSTPLRGSRPENTPKTRGKRIENPGGHSPIRSDRYVPPVRAGFSAQNSLKAGLHFVLSKVETGHMCYI